LRVTSVAINESPSWGQPPWVFIITMTNKENTSLSDKIIESKLAMKYRDICVKDVKASIQELKIRCTGITHCNTFKELIDKIFGKELCK